ncbi:MAG: N-6 DNA methylase [Theionarchaea archaeon]|nr:N-6 DNA methylase [Theionarchaea archaeon]
MKKKKKSIQKGGIYYTPLPIVKYILEKTVKEILFREDRPDSPRITIIDPACGCGIFLFQALECITRWQNEGTIKRYPQLPSTHPVKLYGVDLDDHARSITSMALTLCNIHDHIQFQIKQGNTLVSWLPLDTTKEEYSSRMQDLVHMTENLRAHIPYRGNIESIEKTGSIKEKINLNLNQKLKKDYFPHEPPDHPFNWQIEFPEIFDIEKNEKERGFDVVIGNPPWVSHGLREMTRISNEMHAYYCQTFYGAEYKISISSLFIERGICLLCNHGLLGFILPDSFLLGRFFSRIRKYILDTTKIREILLIGEEFWSSGTSGRSVLLILEKESDEISRKGNVMSIHYCDTLQDLEDGNFTTCSYPQSRFETAHLNRFRLYFHEKSYSLVNKIQQISVPLKEFAHLYSGCIGRHGQNSIISDEKTPLFRVIDEEGACVYEDSHAVGKWKPLLTSGKDIEKYIVTGKGKFVYVDPDKNNRRIYAKSGFRVENYSGKKVFIRQTGDSLVAAYDEKGYFCLNNMHVLRCLMEAYNIGYFLAILNSHLMNTYYHLITLEVGRTLPQTDIETLKELPIKPINFEDEGERNIYEKIVMKTRLLVSLKEKLHEEMQNTTSQSAFSIESDREAVRKMEEDLNTLIYQLYGVKEAEIREIGKGIHDLSPPYTKIM